MAFDPTQELDGADEGVDSTSNGEASTTQETTTTRQPNWNDDPKFKEWQSRADKRAEDERRARYEAEQRLAAMEAAVHQTRMQGMDETQQLAYQNQLLQQQVVKMQQIRDNETYAMQRQRDLEDIVRKTGVPIDQIEDAANVHVAWQIGYDYKESKKPTCREEIDSIADDRVDIASGKPQGKSSALQAKYDSARKAYNLREQLEVMTEADRKGVTLNEW